MGENMTTYINNIKSSINPSIMTVEHRSNNPKRDFLFCNKIQGKHIPTRPHEAFQLFDKLLDQVVDTLRGKKVLVIGFAETATAISNYIGDNLPNCVYYTQTTREKCKAHKRLIEFQEEHSHATEQYLYGDWNSLPEFDYILFVEDEISTGKTILNFISEIKKIKQNIKFGVASICNWQNEENKAKYKSLNIDTFALITGQLVDEHAKMDVDIKKSIVHNTYATYCATHRTNRITVKKLSSKLGIFELERTGRSKLDVSTTISRKELIKDICKEVSDFAGDSPRVLVLGTEEFMSIPMLAALSIDNKYREVYTHSTSRSSIDVIADTTDKLNGICNKHKLHSAYDKNRDTYIYNIQPYDRCIIITDGETNMSFIDDITAALVDEGNHEEDILVIKVE